MKSSQTDEYGYPVDHGQSIGQWLYEWEQIEKERIKKCAETFSAWLEAQDKSKWIQRTIEMDCRIWVPDTKVDEYIEKIKKEGH